jgi:hypothetical protein
MHHVLTEKKIKGKRLLGKPRRIWENNIKTDLSMVWECRPELPVSGHGLMMAYCEYGNDSWGSVNVGEYLDDA